MNLELIDIQSLSSIRNSVSELTGLPFSIYDGMGGLLTTPQHEDRIVAQVTSYSSGREEYDSFIRAGISKTAIRNNPAILKGPVDQHYLFIPVNLNTMMLVLVSAPFFLDKNDFERFLVRNGPRFGFSLSTLDAWSDTLRVKDYGTIQNMAAPVKSLFETVLKSTYERNLNHRRYQWTKTLIDLLFNLQLPVPAEELYSLVLDAVLFLFNVDTSSIIVRENGSYRTVMSAGRLKDEIRSLRIKENDLISQSIDRCSMTSTNDIAAISALGFPDSVTSLQVFPRIRSGKTDGALLIFNSLISRDESYSILEFLKLVSLVLNNLSLQNSYNKCISNFEVLNIASSRLCPELHNPDGLYKAIVDTATELIKAEKGSLMLPENGGLAIKAVKGINRWLTQDISVKVGEGIAGRVFDAGKPFLAKDRDALNAVSARPRHHYKTGSFVSVPLTFNSERVGVLNVSDKATGEEFTEMDLNLLNYFASYASIALKVSSYRNLAEHMKELSITDPLTGLFNRRYLQERFTEEVRRSGRHGMVFSFVIFDIDNFKLFNDTEGHLEGDKVLEEVAKITHASLRGHDIVCRFGGEEFAVLMPQTSKDEAFTVAERIRKSVRETFMSRWEKFPHNSITVSMGVASFPGDGENVNELIKNADTALYQAKALGKNRTLMHTRKEQV
ncbi:MAG TPA: sensor domain-containing diguanylate cyclase [Dissulfurispiraceae bacterium]